MTFSAATFATSTLLGGSGADTATFTGLVSSSKVTFSGTGAHLISAQGGVSSSTLIGGAGADTIDFTGAGFGASQVIGGGGNDTFKIAGSVLNSTIVGGAGNDSIEFTHTDTDKDGSSTNTYFFGVGGGADTINFGGTGLRGTKDEIAFTIAVDSTYGATSGYSFVSSTGKLSRNDSNFLTITGITGSSANSPSAMVSTTTVSTSVITALDDPTHSQLKLEGL